MTVSSVGVDLGGTWLRVCAVDAVGRLLKKAKLPAPAPEALARTLRELWKRWRIQRPRRLTVGSRGVWKPSKRKAMARALAGLAERVAVMSDAELAFLSVLGKGPGVLVLAGTGSIALARDRRGRWRRAGGLGPEKGDEGSGYWIGREYERRILERKKNFSRGAVRKTAALAVRSFRDPRCAPILDEASGHLAALAAAAAKKAGLGRRWTVGWSGGVLAFPEMRRRVYVRLPPGTRKKGPRVPAALTAALIGRP